MRNINDFIDESAVLLTCEVTSEVTCEVRSEVDCEVRVK